MSGGLSNSTYICIYIYTHTYLSSTSCESSFVNSSFVLLRRELGSTLPNQRNQQTYVVTYSRNGPASESETSELYSTATLSQQLLEAVEAKVSGNVTVTDVTDDEEEVKAEWGFTLSPSPS